AIVEAEDGGVFRSDNGGLTWTKTSDDRNLRQRAWYYTRIYAVPKAKDEVFVANVGLWRSADAGRTFQPVHTPHGDHHDLWIDPDVVYGGNHGGLIGRINHRTREQRNVTVWPDNPMGHGAADLKYRFQWNFPIFFSPHDPNTLYVAGNALFKTTNEGQSWQPI